MKKFIIIIIVSVISSFNNLFAQGNWITLPNAPSLGRYDDISFINNTTGFVSQSSEVYKTTDKGQTWNLISLLDSNNIQYVRSLEFINDTVGFAGLLNSSGPLTGNLFKTIDGGYSWTLLQNMQIQPFDGICGMAHYGNTLIAVGTYGSNPWFYRTVDFGLSWIKADLSSLASGLVDCYMIDNDTLLVSGIADASNQFKATILKSYDGGNTWQRVYLAPNPTSYCWKMFFRPNGIGLASVQSGSPIIARTTDFGTTWTTQSVYNSSNSDLGGIGLLNDTLGWVTDQYGFGTWETTDGGLVWNIIGSPVEAGDRMIVLDSANALMSGRSIYKYALGTTGIQNPTTVTRKKIHELIIYPNPANKIINIEALAGTNTFGLLDILDEKGVLLKHVARQTFKKGKHSFSQEIINLAAGNYKLLWRTNELFLSKDFVVVK